MCRLTPGRRDTYGYALLLGGHTGSPRRMKDQEVIIGTRHDATCAPTLAPVVSAIFTRHDFNVHENVAGYTGGDIVATFGQPRTQRVHALQLEIDAALLMTTSRDEFICAYHAASRDDALLKELYPVLEEIVRLHRAGTRYGIKEDAADGLLMSGEPGAQLTWMDVKVGDRVVTPRTGKAVEINALCTTRCSGRRSRTRTARIHRRRSQLWDLGRTPHVEGPLPNV